MRNQNKFNNSFNYKKNFRLSLLDKFFYLNSFECPRIYSSSLIIELGGLEDFDSLRVVAAMFILRILSGRRPYITRFGLFQTFYDKRYDATVQVILIGAGSVMLLGLMSTEILPFLSKLDFSKFVKIENNGVCAVSFTVSDLSFIRVVETHSIFFKWHDKVHFRFKIKSDDVSATEAYLKFFNL